MINLAVSIGSLRLKNPIMLASGVWEIQLSEMFDFSILGAVVLKGVNLKGKIGNLPPRIVETPCGMLNSIGLENPGVDELISHINDYKALNTPIIANIFGNSTDEYGEVAKRLLNYVDGFEVNISCPNVKESGVIFGRDPGSAFDITKKVRNSIGNKPLIVKLTPDTDKILAVAKAVKDGGADAISCSNTFTGLVVDIDTFKPMLGGVTGGLSGPAIKPLSIYRVWMLSKQIRIPIIGIGGITSPEDAIEYFIAGASAVQIGSGLFRNPTLPVEVIEGLIKYLEKRRMNSINNIVGKLEV